MINNKYFKIYLPVENLGENTANVNKVTVFEKLKSKRALSENVQKQRKNLEITQNL